MKTVITTLVLVIALVYSTTTKAQSVKINQINASIEKEESETMLKWSTSREVNTSYFIVEKSTDGIIYTQIATVKASGNSVFPHNYQFADINKTIVPSTFRIVLVTMDGGQIASLPFSNTQSNMENIAAK
jgi:hypothetical protein